MDANTRRKQVSALNEQGLSVKDIAARLGVSTSTVYADRKAAASVPDAPVPRDDATVAVPDAQPQVVGAQVKTETPSSERIITPDANLALGIILGFMSGVFVTFVVSSLVF